MLAERAASASRRRAITLLTALGIAVVAAVVVINVVADRGRHLGSAEASLLATVPAALVAALLVDRRPGTGVGRCLAVLATSQVLSVLFRGLGRMAREQGWGGADFLDRLSDACFVGTLPVLFVLLVVFPDGAKGPWRHVARTQVVALAGIAGMVVAGLDPGPATVPSLVLLALVAGAAAVRVVSLIVAWRRASGDARAPYAWFVTSVVSLIGVYVAGGLARLGGSRIPDGFVLFCALALLPSALGLAIVRRRLYDLDLVVNRTLVLSLTSTLLLLAYVVLAALLGQLGARPGSLVASGVPAVVAAMTLGRVRGWSQQAVDRALYGDRDQPDRALRGLGEQLSQALAPEDVPQRIVDAVRAAIRSPWVELSLESGDVTTSGHQPAQVVEEFAVEHARRQLGVLKVAPRPGEEQLDPRDRALLSDLARQAAVALYAGRLAADLTASRERLVVGREDERARLRRDLHDELSPSLSGIALTVGAARSRLDTDPAEAARLLARVAEETTDAAAVIRRLLAGLQPAGVAELGVVAAIEERTQALALGGPMSVAVTAGPITAVDPLVEVAAYRIAIEGVTNALRHSGGSHVHVQIESDHEQLRIVVDDDGVGVPRTPSPGVGLASAHDRAVEVGGTLEVSRPPGGGTRLVAVLPLELSA